MSEAFPFDRVSVVGLGLMGGSLARALRALPDGPEVVGWSPDDAEGRAALEAGAVHRLAPSAEAAAGEESLVVYATPLAAVLELLERHAPAWRAEAAISDVASLKAPVVARVRELGVESSYVGAHPMVGGEASGFAASRADLYRNAPVWLATGTGTGELRERVEAAWTCLSARPAWTDAGDHDRRMVRASHLPQLVSNALGERLRREGLDPWDLGPGGRDMTRLAASSPALWRDLLTHSAPRLAPLLRELAVTLEELATLLERGDVEAVSRRMEDTRRWAAPTPASRPGEETTDDAGRRDQGAGP